MRNEKQNRPQEQNKENGEVDENPKDEMREGNGRNKIKTLEDWDNEMNVVESSRKSSWAEDTEAQTTIEKKSSRANALLKLAITILTFMCAFASFSDNFNSLTPTAEVQVLNINWFQKKPDGDDEGLQKTLPTTCTNPTLMQPQYYCFLVPLSLPILLVALYFHWLSMRSSSMHSSVEDIRSTSHRLTTQKGSPIGSNTGSSHQCL
ncbi:hypothetical protein K7X08_005050 [Anisodus acutangulus]|uniref:Transmembrane protein n=1 Tax=Anisodus acutangulus TaxID=402998 RepID=A0A9Q1RIR6_9SOLA|nr:hypothetical protein K7X08_005050 [Anisodus acutangulus]